VNRGQKAHPDPQSIVKEVGNEEDRPESRATGAQGGD
jgi:hypothetical protein